MIGLGPAFGELLAVLDRMEIPYFVVGSIASCSYGFPRYTNDIDIVADFRNTDIASFCSLLEGTFYIDALAVTEAIAAGRSFNAIHLKGSFKFDFFPAAAEGFVQSELGRRRYLVSALPGIEGLEFAVSSPEDTVLSKLVWFRKGGGVSDHQWHDVLAVISVRSTALDFGYLREWAAKLNVSDLLEKAILEAPRA